MSDPYRIFPGKFKATGQDLEVWIRHCLDQHRLQYWFRVKREDLDETRKRFRLLFFGTFFSSNYPTAEVLWGIADLIEWSDGVTEILQMWVWSPENWEPKFYRKKIHEILDERIAWLQELDNEIREKFEGIAQTNKQVNEDQAAETEIINDIDISAAKDTAERPTKRKTIDLQNKAAGRKVDPSNPIAFDILNDGNENSEKRAFEYWCSERGIENPSRGDRDAFKKAMHREHERRG
jgi:hypothetical protein